MGAWEGISSLRAGVSRASFTCCSTELRATPAPGPGEREWENNVPLALLTLLLKGRQPPPSTAVATPAAHAWCSFHVQWKCTRGTRGKQGTASSLPVRHWGNAAPPDPAEGPGRCPPGGQRCWDRPGARENPAARAETNGLGVTPVNPATGGNQHKTIASSAVPCLVSRLSVATSSRGGASTPPRHPPLAPVLRPVPLNGTQLGTQPGEPQNIATPIL